MSLVAYADSDEDSDDNESSEAVSPSVDGQERTASNEDRAESLHLPHPAVLGQ